MQEALGLIPSTSIKKKKKKQQGGGVVKKTEQMETGWEVKFLSLSLSLFSMILRNNFKLSVYAYVVCIYL
jgi:hypothetical protein